MSDYTSSGNICEFTPGGTQSTFASGLPYSEALAFDSEGNLFDADFVGGNIYKFTPGGTRSTFASGLPAPVGLAFQDVTLPVPEPATWRLLALSAASLFIGLRLRRRSS